MALSTTPVDTNRGTTALQLTPEQSSMVWAGAEAQSAVMQLAERIALPGRGLSIPVITGDAVAEFVAESTEKAVSKPSLESKLMTPYKIAVIELFSDEFRRDLPALYDELVRRAPAAIAKKFDATVFNGTAPGTGFDVLTNSTAVGIGGGSKTTYEELIGALETIGTADGRMNGLAMSAQGEALLLSAVDGSNRPLFIDSAANDGAVGRVLGAQVVRAQQAYAAGTPNTIGFAGDWTQARYGIVDGINIAFSNEATINDGTQQINLWQRNMFAVRIEAEVGFVVRNSAAFVKLTDAQAE